MLVLKVEEGPEPRNVEKERKWDLSRSLQNAALLDTLTVPSETPAGLLTSRAVGNEPACSSYCVVVSYRSVRKLHPPAVISPAVHSRVPWYLQRRWPMSLSYTSCALQLFTGTEGNRTAGGLGTFANRVPWEFTDQSRVLIQSDPFPRTVLGGAAKGG